MKEAVPTIWFWFNIDPQKLLFLFYNGEELVDTQRGEKKWIDYQGPGLATVWIQATQRQGIADRVEIITVAWQKIASMSMNDHGPGDTAKLAQAIEMMPDKNRYTDLMIDLSICQELGDEEIKVYTRGKRTVRQKMAETWSRFLERCGVYGSQETDGSGIQ